MKKPLRCKPDWRPVEEGKQPDVHSKRRCEPKS
jgi:hypothetical protein